MSEQEQKQRKKLPPKGGGGSDQNTAGLEGLDLDHADMIAALSGGIDLARRIDKELSAKLKAEQPRSCFC